MKPALSLSQVGMLRALDSMSGDRTLMGLARYAGTTPAGAARSLRSLENRSLARETAYKTFSITGEGRRALEAHT